MSGETVAFDGRQWCTTSVRVSQIGPSDSGVWLISTNGTRHVWDLDRQIFSRTPGEQTRAAPMPFDQKALRWTRVGAYPRVGCRLIVWFDDPRAHGPAVLEHYRVSSTIESIEQLVGCDR